MKKEIVNLKVYVSLLTLLYLAYFIYIAITKGEISIEQGFILPVILYNLLVNIMLNAKEEIGVKQILPLAAISLLFGAVSVNIIALIGAVVLFVGYYRYYVAHKLEKNNAAEPEYILTKRGVGYYFKK